MKRNRVMCLLIILGFLLFPLQVAAEFDSIDVDLAIGASTSSDVVGIYLADGDHIYIDINTTVIIDIHLRKTEIIDINSWSNQYGEIHINYTPPFDYGAMYITFYNTETIDGFINGTIYFGTNIVTTVTTSPPSTTTGWTLPPPPPPPDTGFWLFDWIILFFTTMNFVNGFVGGTFFGFVIALVLFWRYNRDKDTTFLVNVDKDKLIDKNWTPE